MPTPILGRAQVSAEAVREFIYARSPRFADLDELVTALAAHGTRLGVRWDVAAAQMLIETGNFAFGGGTAVRPEQHNYGGLGVTRKGMRGESFPTVAAGVLAHLQHLWAYATTRPLPVGPVYDRRFGLVVRGSAPNWEDLGRGLWAADPDYADKILDLYRQMPRTPRPPEVDDLTPDQARQLAELTAAVRDLSAALGVDRDWPHKAMSALARIDSRVATLLAATAALATGQGLAQADLDALQAAVAELDADHPEPEPPA